MVCIATAAVVVTAAGAPPGPRVVAIEPLRPVAAGDVARFDVRSGRRPAADRFRIEWGDGTTSVARRTCASARAGGALTVGHRYRERGDYVMRVVPVARCGGTVVEGAEKRLDHRVFGATAVVPRVRGRTSSRAECALAGVGLRWRYRGRRRAMVTPAAPGACRGTAEVEPDPKITGQRPRAGTRVPVGTVVRLRDECDDLPPEQACL